mgnify:CR=1 FL=1
MLPQPPASRSVGASEWMSDKAMWSRAHATPGLKIEEGVLKGMVGGLEAKQALTELVIPHGVWPNGELDNGGLT